MKENMEMKERNLPQEKIIDRFRELIEEMDAQQITFQHSAKRLDIKAPSLHNYFKNIRDVKIALTAKPLQELNDQLRRALVGKNDQEVPRIYVETYRSSAFSNQAVYELLINMPHTNEAALLGGIHEMGQIILQILETFQLAREEKVHQSRELRSMIRGYLSLHLLGHFTKEPTINPGDNYFWIINDFIATLP